MIKDLFCLLNKKAPDEDEPHKGLFCGYTVILSGNWLLSRVSKKNKNERKYT